MNYNEHEYDIPMWQDWDNKEYDKYVDDYEMARSRNVRDINVDYGDVNTFFRLSFVLLARLGFVLIQVGTIPVENVYRITLYNIFEIGNTILSYVLIGYTVSFGKSSLGGWMGYSNDLSHNLDRAIFGLSACLIGAGQISCFLIGRLHLACSIFLTFLYCACFQPLLMHWIWTIDGWMNRSIFLDAKVSIKDYGGNLVIHLSSSLIGTIGAIFLGRRLIKVKDLDEHSLAHEHSGNTLTGQIFVLLGYIAFNLPTPVYDSARIPENYIAIILINNFVAFGLGVLIVCFLHLIIFRNIYNYWTVLRCFQGGMAGVISIAAAVDIYSHFECMAVSSVASIFFFFFAILIHNSSLEDNSNLISSHLIPSIWGSLACSLLAHEANFDKSYRKVHVLWQLICLSTVFGFSLVFAWLVFLIFTLCKVLRNEQEVQNHRRAVIVQRYLPKKGALTRLFMIDSKTDHIVPGDLKRKPYMQDKVTRTAVELA